MNTPREPIMQALKETLRNALPEFNTVTRRLRSPDQFKPPDCPALMIDEPAEHVARAGQGMPSKTTIPVTLWVILKNGMDPNDEPIVTLNNILDQIDAALAPPPCFESFTLGGLVESCRIEGTIQKDAGEIGKIAIAVVPLTILIP